MKEYRIKTAQRKGERFATMIIVSRETGEEIAEYPLTVGEETKEVRRMRRVIDNHLDNGGTLGNYQW